MYSPGLIGRNDSSKPNLYLAGFLLPECSVLAEDEEYRPWASVRETVIFPVGTGNLSSIWSAAAVGSAIYLPEMLPHIETGRARRNANGVPAGAVKTLPRSISPMVALTAGPVNAAPIIVPTIPQVVDRWLDVGYGSCILARADCKSIMESSLAHFDRIRYELVGRDGGYTAKVADVCCIVPTVNPQDVTPHSEAFQAVIWHLLVSHQTLKVQQTKWESTR